MSLNRGLRSATLHTVLTVGPFVLAVAIGTLTALSAARGVGAFRVLLATALLVASPVVVVALVRWPFMLLCGFAFVLVNPLTISDKLSILLPALSDRLELRELMMALILALAVASLWKRRHSMWRSSMQDAAVLLCWLVVLSIVVSILRGASPRAALAEGIPWALYGLLPVATPLLIRDRKQLWFVAAAFVLAAVIGSVLSFIQTLVGPGTVLVGAYSLKAFHGNVRVYTESQGMSLISLSIVLAYLTKTRGLLRRAALLVATLLLLMGLLVAFSRTLMIAALLVCLLTIWYGEGESKRLRAMVLLAAVVSIVAVLASAIGGTTSLMSTMVEWFLKVVGPGGHDFLSVVVREVQYQVAVTRMLENPLWGVGLGKPFFNPAEYGLSVGRGITVHNGFLQVGVKLGLLGLAAFLYWVYRGLRDTRTLARDAAPEWRPLGVGLLIGLGAVWLVCNLVTWVVGPPALAQIGLAVGIAETHLLQAVESQAQEAEQS